MKSFMILIALLLALPVNSFAFNPKTASIEEKVVFLNTDTPVSTIDPIKVNRVRFLLDKLQERHPESRHDIFDLTVRVQGVMEGSGIRESLIDIMESTAKVHLDKRIGKMTYRDLATAYATLRIDGMSRSQSVQGLIGFFEGIARTKKR